MVNPQSALWSNEEVRACMICVIYGGLLSRRLPADAVSNGDYLEDKKTFQDETALNCESRLSRLIMNVSDLLEPHP